MPREVQAADIGDLVKQLVERPKRRKFGERKRLANQPRPAKQPWCLFCGGPKRNPNAKTCSPQCADLLVNPDAPRTTKEVWQRARGVRAAFIVQQRFDLDEETMIALERALDVSITKLPPLAVLTKMRERLELMGWVEE